MDVLCFFFNITPISQKKKKRKYKNIYLIKDSHPSAAEEIVMLMLDGPKNTEDALRRGFFFFIFKKN